MSQKKIKQINKDKPVTIDLTQLLVTPEDEPMMEGNPKDDEPFTLGKALMVAVIKPDSERGLSRSQKSRNYKLFKKFRDAGDEGKADIKSSDIELLLEMTHRGWGGWVYGQIEEILEPLTQSQPEPEGPGGAVIRFPRTGTDD